MIVPGPPGSGTSTLAPRLAEQRTPSVLIEGDEFFGFLRRGEIEPSLVKSRHQNKVVTASAGAATKQFETAALARRHVIDEFTGTDSELVDSIVERVESGQLAYPG